MDNSNISGAELAKLAINSKSYEELINQLANLKITSNGDEYINYNDENIFDDDDENIFDDDDENIFDDDEAAATEAAYIGDLEPVEPEYINYNEDEVEDEDDDAAATDAAYIGDLEQVEPEYTVKNNIIVVKCNEINRYPAIRERLEMIQNNCGWTFECCYYMEQCNSIIAMACSDHLTELTLNYLENNPEIIVAMLVMIIFNEQQMGEIYNVCTLKDFRGFGYMSDIFQYVIELIEQNELLSVWLGVELENNPILDQLINFYVKKGFFQPSLTRNRGASAYPLDRTVLGLTWNKKIEIDNKRIEYALNVANILVKQYKESANKCSQKLFLPLSLCKSLKEMLTETTELSGDLVTKKITTLKNEFSYRELKLGKETYIGTHIENLDIVQIPFTEISFHTHPAVCNFKLGCYEIWPSGLDMEMLIGGYPDRIKHYVITQTGIYSINLTLDAQKLFNKDKEIQYKLAQIAKEYYGSIEFQRDKNLSEQDYRFSQYLYVVNSQLITQLISGLGDEYNFSIFTVNFFSWEYITNNGGIVDYMVNSKKC